MKYLLLISVLIISLQASAKVIYEKESEYQKIVVTDEKLLLCMVFIHKDSKKYRAQGCKYPTEPNAQVLEYTQAVLSSLLIKKDPARVLVIGLGVGTIPEAIKSISPTAYIEVVELDPAVLEAAKEVFRYDQEEDITEYIGDGRVFVKKAAANGIKYDLIVLDAMDAEYIPEHLLTIEFLEEVKSILVEGGIVAANTFLKDGLYSYESATYEKAFGTFFNIKTGNGRDNRVIIASNSPFPSDAEIQQNAKDQAEYFYTVFGINVNDLLIAMDRDKDWPQGSTVLTDEYSPSNLLAAKKGPIYKYYTLYQSHFNQRPYFVGFATLVIFILVLFLITKITDFFVARRSQELSQ